MLELPANVLLATDPACSERRHRQPSRRSHERKLGDQTKDDADKEPREERSCGRSQTLLYNRASEHPSGYVIDEKRFCWLGCDPAGYFRFCRARSVMD